MKELQAKAKVTQTMTRDGLVVEIKRTALWRTFPAGRRNRIILRISRARPKNTGTGRGRKGQTQGKEKAKQAAETAESEDGLHRSAARLELTEEERADPALQPYIQKAEAKADKLDAARAALPKKRVPVKEKFTMQPAARQNPPCGLSSRTKARPA